MSPGLVLLREDSETLLLEKSFSVPAGTNFGEAISGINIDVQPTPADQCNVGRVNGRTVTDCEDWVLSVTDATPATYRIEALVPASFALRSVGSVSFVDVFPNTRGTAAVESVTANGELLLARDGTVLSRGDEAVARGERFFQPRKATLSIAVPANQLPGNVTQVSATAVTDFRPEKRFEDDTLGDVTASYGLALTADNEIYEWGWRQAQRALIGADGRDFPYSLGDPFVEFVESGESTRREVIQTNLQSNVRQMSELSVFATNNNADWVDVLALDRPEPARYDIESRSYSLDTALPFRSGITGAALAADGRVAIWGDPLGSYVRLDGGPLGERSILRPDRTIAEDISREPRWVQQVGDIRQITTEDGALVLLDGAGRVWFGSGRSVLDRTRATFVRRVTDLPAGSVIQISGMRALMADGTVWQWRLSDSGDATPVRQVPEISNAVALPDPAQNLAILADGSVATWIFADGTTMPTRAATLDVPDIGPIADVSGDVFVDADCGRGWRRLVDTGGNVVMLPLIGLGGGDTCDAGLRSHLVQILIVSDRTSVSTGDTVITSSDGPVTCATDSVRRCWWLGDASNTPSFTVDLPSGGTVRDWRWDCASTSAQSMPVQLRSAGEPGSASLCKLTLTKGDTGLPSTPRRTLQVGVSGPGSVVSSPVGIDCGSMCSASFDSGTRVTLTATAAVDAGFLGWVDNGCTDDLANAMITVTLSADTVCTAEFESIAAANLPPVARFTIMPFTMVRVGDPIELNGNNSFDNDGTVVDWSWDFDADGIEDANGRMVTTQFTTAGQKDVTLTVTDDDGAQSSLTQGLIVSAGLSAPPTASFTISPSNTQAPGSTFTFDASASTDDVGIVSYAWDLSANGSFEGSGVTYSLTLNDIGIRQMRLRVTDADGQFADQLQDVIVENPPRPSQFAVRIFVNGPGQVDVSPFARTLPDGACDGTECFLFDVPEGTVVTLVAAPFTPSVFQGWSATECDNIPNADTCEITVTSQREVSATFN
ncbi:MAG: PKD domain-containing protein [Pseudomonadota bacterium]